MTPALSRARARAGRCAAGAALSALLLLGSVAVPAAFAAATDNARAEAIVEQRRAVEKASRSRYRDLEVASLVVILAAGGAAIWWTLRRK